MASWHLVSPDGRIHSGGAAIPELLRLLPGGTPFAALAGLAPGVTEGAYRLVSEHRDQLAAMLGAMRRSVDPKRRRAASDGD